MINFIIGLCVGLFVSSIIYIIVNGSYSGDDE